MKHAEHLLPHGRNGKTHVSKGLGLARQEVSSISDWLHSTYCKPWHPSFLRLGDLTWTSRSVSVFQTSECPSWKKKKQWPFFRDEATPELRVSIPAKVGNLEYAMSLQPKNSLLQRRLAEAKDWHPGSDFPGLCVFFVGLVARTSRTTVYYRVEYNWSGEVSSYLVTCQAAFCIFWMVLRTSRSWAIRNA